MRKLLIGVLIVLLTTLAVFGILKGISIGNFRIPGQKDIAQASDKLTVQIDNVTAANQRYEQKIDEIKSHINALKSTKKAYLDLVNVSSDSDIKAATQAKEYAVEFLWSRVGNHATKEGVNIKMEIANSINGGSLKDLKFTVVGNYIAIANFIYAIENDSSLAFTIDNFSIAPSNGTENLQATFSVKGITIKKENSTASVNTKNENGNTEDAETNADEETTTNTERTPNTNANTSTTTTDSGKKEGNN